MILNNQLQDNNSDELVQQCSAKKTSVTISLVLDAGQQNSRHRAKVIHTVNIQYRLLCIRTCAAINPGMHADVAGKFCTVGEHGISLSEHRSDDVKL